MPALVDSLVSFLKLWSGRESVMQIIEFEEGISQISNKLHIKHEVARAYVIDQARMRGVKV